MWAGEQGIAHPRMKRFAKTLLIRALPRWQP